MVTTMDALTLQISVDVKILHISQHGRKKGFLKINYNIQTKPRKWLGFNLTLINQLYQRSNLREEDKMPIRSSGSGNIYMQVSQTTQSGRR